MQVFDPDGRLLTEWKQFGRPKLGAAEEVAADDQGNVYAGITNKKVLKKYVKN